MRQRAEHELDIVERRVFGGDEPQLAPTDAGARPALIVSARERQLEARVTRNESAELSARVPAGAENSNWNLIHRECIIMHALQVNDMASLSRLRTRRETIRPGTHGR